MDERRSCATLRWVVFVISWIGIILFLMLFPVLLTVASTPWQNIQ